MIVEAKCSNKLTNSILKRLASLKSRKLHSRDLDLLAWVARIHTRASSSFGNAESTETGNGYVFALLERLCDALEHSIENLRRSLFCHAC